MEFEQDYLMRMIKQMIAALINALLGKENKMVELPLEEQYVSSQGLLHELLTLVNAGRINEAENIMYESFDFNDRQDVESAVVFYSYLNGLTDEALEKCNYARDEIELGLAEVARRTGVEGVLEIFK